MRGAPLHLTPPISWLAFFIDCAPLPRRGRRRPTIPYVMLVLERAPNGPDVPSAFEPPLGVHREAMQHVKTENEN